MSIATSDLHFVCLALDVEPDDLVWTLPLTFVACANCAEAITLPIYSDLKPKQQEGVMLGLLTLSGC